MTNPTPTGVIAGIDETVYQPGGDITYILAGVVFREAHAARRAFEQLIADRKGPFHWIDEGPNVQDAAVGLLEDHVVATYLLARTTADRHRVGTRQELLAHLVAELLNDGVDHVIIESSQSPTIDGWDRDTILDSFRADSANRTFAYYLRTKTEPLLWYPDALAGVALEVLTDRHTHHFRRLQRAEVITEIRYPNSDH